MSWRKRFGISVCNSTATSPRRPCVLMTTARVIHSLLAPSSPDVDPLILFDDRKRVPLILLRARRAQHVAQRARHASRASNDPAQVSLGHFELDDGFVSVFVLVNKNLALDFDDRLSNVFNHDARAGGRLDHSVGAPELASV